MLSERSLQIFATLKSKSIFFSGGKYRLKSIKKRPPYISESQQQL